MIKVTIHKERHIIYNENPKGNSLSNLILLRNQLLNQDIDFLSSGWMVKVEYNTNFLKYQLNLNNKLTCAYCQKQNLFINEDFTIDPLKEFLATVDHVIPISKGGEEFNYNNLVVCCWKCNQKKETKIGQKISNTHYSY